MAEKKKTEKKDEKRLDRTYIIPIRRLSLKVAKWRRAKKAISVIRAFMKRHMKSDETKLGQELNELIWERGGKSIPPKVEVRALREEGIVKVNLVGAPLPSIKKEEKKEKKKVEKKEEPKKEEKKEEPKKEEKPEEPKEEEKAKPKSEEK